MNGIVQSIRKDFVNKFSSEPLLIRAPGIINLIGEHTDYNDGLVLPAAIDRAAYVAIQKTKTSDCTIIATDYGAKITFDINMELTPEPEGDWINYAIGVVDRLKKKRIFPAGFDMIIASDIPIGSGLSSSGAVTCGIAYALNNLFQFGFTNLEIAKVGHEVENGFVGSHSGVKDQLACCVGKAGHVLRLDCQNLDCSYIPIDLGNYEIVLFDTLIKKKSFDHEFNLRQEQCKLGVLAMKELRPEISSLRDVSMTDLEAVKERINPLIYNRCKFVIEENIRVAKACKAILSKDMIGLGKLMFDSHMGLRKLFEVTERELNVLGRLAKYEDDVIGARMMGEGFGGCTINLIKKGTVDRVVNVFKEEYKILAMSEFEVYKVQITDGMSVVEN